MEDSWDAEKDNVVPTIQKRNDRWEGEDEDEDVKDNWDDEEEEVKSDSLPSEGSKPAPSKKKTLAQKIAEKEEKQRLELEEKLRLKEAEKPRTGAELLAYKLEQQLLQEESDLKLAKEAFGITDGKESSASGGGVGLDDVPLSSKSDFEAFKKSLVARLQSVERSPHYVNFLDNAFRDLCVSLEPDDIKRISNNLNALFNEKVKAQKATKAKKKTGKSVKMERSAIDFEGDAGYDEFDDFI